MAWTYTDTLATNRDKVRFRIGDTNTDKQLLTDNEIAAQLTVFSNDIPLTVVSCIKGIIAKLARDYDRSNVGMSAQRSQQIQHYRDLLAEYQGSGVEGVAGNAEGFVGGLSQDTEEDFDDDEDYKGPHLRRGMDDINTDVNPRDKEDT